MNIKEAYYMRLNGASWVEIAEALGYSYKTATTIRESVLNDLWSEL